MRLQKRRDKYKNNASIGQAFIEEERHQVNKKPTTNERSNEHSSHEDDSNFRDGSHFLVTLAFLLSISHRKEIFITRFQRGGRPIEIGEIHHKNKFLSESLAVVMGLM